MEVAIIDLRLNNLGSVIKVLELCNVDISVVDKVEKFKKPSAVILPGVGSFNAGMDRLIETGLGPLVYEAVRGDQVPILGICLGMHLMAGSGEEGGLREGLSLIPGNVKRLEVKKYGLKCPHIGWNEVNFSKPAQIFHGINTGEDFYFVHSYCFCPENSDHILSRTPYGENFVSCVSKDDLIYGVQFHPEKSSKKGHALIKNFLEIVRIGEKC